MLAGFIFALFLDIFMLTPWIIAVYPTILTAKGVIAGILAGRLGTALHIGTIYPRFTGNTKTFYRLFDIIIVVNLLVSLLMSSIAIVFGLLFWGIRVGNFIEIILNVTATMALGLTISLLTAYISFSSFRFGWDPDVIVYPAMSSMTDAIITIYYALIISAFFIFGNVGKAAVIAIAIFYLVFAAFIVLRNIHEEEFIRSIKEILLTLIMVAFTVNVTGTFLGRISAIIEERREVYTVYPSLIDMIGDVGSVVGSTTTTRLALGLINPSFKDLKKLKEHILGSWLSSLIVFAALSATSLALNGLLEQTYFARFTLILTMVNIIAVPLILLVSYLVSILTFKRGFNPDNFVIPIESSLADSIATLSLLLVLLLTYR
ncbi:MAG: magnesium transporter [Candidatus Bathyarchaeia archaeon]